MTLPVAIAPPPLVTDDGGTVRVGGSRVTLDSVVAAFDDGASAEEIVARYPSLDLADVYATITYLLQHRPEVDAYLAERDTVAAAHRAEADRRWPRDDLRARLLRRREQS